MIHSGEFLSTCRSIPIFISICLQMMAKEFQLFQQGRSKKNTDTLAIDDSNQIITKNK